MARPGRGGLIARRRHRHERAAWSWLDAAVSARRCVVAGVVSVVARAAAMASVGNLLYGSGSPELSGFTVLFWLIGFGLVCGLIFATMWSLFTLTDLETDHVNPMDACRRLNKMAKLEFTTLVRAPRFGGLCLPAAAQNVELPE